MDVVTGAGGFIGSNLVERLNSPILCDIKGADFTDPSSLFDVLEDRKPDTIYHLGAISATTVHNSVDLVENNILLSCRLLEYCINNDINFVYASSASVYGLGESGFKEDTITKPLNYYANSKICFDFFAQQKIIDNPTAKVVGLRYFNVYGKNEHLKETGASPIHKFFNQAKTTNKIKLFEGSTGFLRDFIHVDDVVDITKKSINFNSGIYNVGTGKANSFETVAQLISNLTGAQIEQIPFPKHLVGKYQHYTCSDNTKINSTGCSTKRLTLEEGIARTIDV